jgi:M6 family metalloprotease-like protein
LSKTQFRQLLFENDLESNESTLPPNYDMSVRDYYHEISNNSLEVFGDDGSIVDWTTVSQNYSYYVDGEQGTGGDSSSAAALVVEIALEHHSAIDFSDFDGNNDGNVDLVILIVEGWGKWINSLNSIASRHNH